MIFRQQSFFKANSEFSSSRIEYGGRSKGGKTRRKVFRPLDRKRPLSITLKSEIARGDLSLLKRRLEVELLVREWAQRLGVTIHAFQNMGNHLHILVSFKRPIDVQRYLKTITGLIARLITRARKGHAFGRKFWTHLAHTRIITGFKDFRRMQHYFRKNEVERELGPAMRQAMELHDDILRQAKRRGVSVEQIHHEMLRQLDRS